jgi:hypothetical protein
LAVAQAEVEALKKQLEQAQSVGHSPERVSQRACAARATSCRRMSPIWRWALVGALQLSGLVAYFLAADKLACME